MKKSTTERKESIKLHKIGIMRQVLIRMPVLLSIVAIAFNRVNTAVHAVDLFLFYSQDGAMGSGLDNLCIMVTHYKLTALLSLVY